MAFSKDFIPKKPFQNFKWKWASLQCTEGLNDPVVLLGVLFRMRKLEKLGLKYSSPEFANELIGLHNDIQNKGIGVDLSSRTGERNLIRNSGQYWRAVGLIDKDSSGIIHLSDFGRKVADRTVSQSEFAAITIQTLKLPNENIQNKAECDEWKQHGLEIYPLRLLLEISSDLFNKGLEALSVDELVHLVIPLSGCNAKLNDYINFISWYRSNEINIKYWPDCIPNANDLRIAREFLLFLSNYGYLNKGIGETRMKERYSYNNDLDDEITEILSTQKGVTLLSAIDNIQSTDVISEMERIRVQKSMSRPNQAKFRKTILKHFERCIITNVSMPEVLEAAHIIPFKYNGEDTVANGFCMRMDIHQLFDAGHLRISADGKVELSGRARMEYGATIPPKIIIPDFTNRDFVKWRWDNYNGM
ncbi:MAG: HNH endonuclease [Bacteroidales bacterium]|nr:HNH endonuclease [Bacteroidales bacterium]